MTAASSEKSFSKLKQIKHYLRPSMSQERLSELGLLSNENELCESLELSNITHELANKKAIRVQF
jgi:DNA-binding GntR family transcriptional regulator